MIYPNLSLAKSNFIDYYNQKDLFDRLIFQFRLSEFYGGQIVSLVCYAMDVKNQPMHSFPIELKKLDDYKNYALPANFGNLIMSKEYLSTIIQKDGIVVDFQSLLFICYQEDLNYIGYEVYVSTSESNFIEQKDRAVTMAGKINPCPPVACSVITSV